MAAAAADVLPRRWTISRPVMSEGEGDAETWEGVGSSSRQLAGDRPEISSGIRSSRGPSMVEMVTSTGGSHSMPSGSMSAQNLSELGEACLPPPDAMV